MISCAAVGCDENVLVRVGVDIPAPNENAKKAGCADRRSASATRDRRMTPIVGLGVVSNLPKNLIDNGDTRCLLARTTRPNLASVI